MYLFMYGWMYVCLCACPSFKANAVIVKNLRVSGTKNYMSITKRYRKITGGFANNVSS